MPPAKVGAYLRDLRRLFDEYGYHAALYGHFGQGCIHGRISFDLQSPEGIKKFRQFLEQAGDLVSVTAARSPASTAMGRRGASSCTRCLARS